jgi:thymidine phosphorylase
MLILGGAAASAGEARTRMERAIASGSAAEKFQQIIEAQGGNPSVVDDPAVLPQALACELYAAPRSGVVAQVEPKTVGRGVIALGGGRTRVEDAVDPTVGFVITARPGDVVTAGEPLATISAPAGGTAFAPAAFGCDLNGFPRTRSGRPWRRSRTSS